MIDFSNYCFNPHAIPVLSAGILIFAIGIFILLQTKKTIKNIAFFFFCLSLSLWLVPMGLVYLSHNPATALWWYKHFVFLGVVNIMPNFYLFSVATAGFLKQRLHVVFVGFILSNIFYILAITTDKLITTPTPHFWGYYPHYEPLAFLWFIVYGILFFSSEAILWRAYKAEKVPIKRAHILTIFTGLLIGFTASFDFVAKIWPITLYPFGFIPSFILSSMIAYSIVRHKAFDIRVVVTRLGIFVCVYSLVLGIPFSLAIWGRSFLTQMLGDGWFWVPMFALLALATTGPSVYIYMQRKAENRFLEEQRRYQRTLRQASSGMIRIKDLRKLLKLIVHIITRTVRIDHSSIYLRDDKSENYLLAAARSRKVRNAVNMIKKDSPLIKHLLEFRQPIVYDEIQVRDNDDAGAQQIEAGLRELDAAVLLPSFVEDRLFAIAILGKKISGTLYSQDDLAAFSILANQAALAIENIQFYHEAQKIQEKLSHTEKLAYLGKLASSVAHEIRNPLTTVKTFIESVTAKYGQKEFRDKFDNLVPREISRIEGIIDQLLDFARPRRLTAQPVNIVNTIDATLALLENNFKLKSVVARALHEKQNVSLPADEDQLRQVFLNLFLNAIQAMEQGGRLGVETRVVAEVDGSKKSFQVKISDTGVGISAENLTKLFTPFHTTKKNGVGLGMPIVKDIIDAHHGTIMAESQEGVGTTFTVCLPMVLTDKVAIEDTQKVVEHA